MTNTFKALLTGAAMLLAAMPAYAQQAVTREASLMETVPGPATIAVEKDPCINGASLENDGWQTTLQDDGSVIYANAAFRIGEQFLEIHQKYSEGTCEQSLTFISYE